MKSMNIERKSAKRKTWFVGSVGSLDAFLSEDEAA